MAKLVYYIFLIILCFIQLLMVRDAYIDIAVYKKGVIVNAKIEKVNCQPRNSNIDLNYLNASHFIMVTFTDCKKGKYQVGDSITVKALPQYSRTQFPNSNAYGGVYIAIFFFLLPILWILAKKGIILYLSGKGEG